MYVKNYRAKSAEECMQKLKADMGRDAVILQSRTVRPLLGRFGPTIHEIVAASDVNTVLDKLRDRKAEREIERQGDQVRLSLSSGSSIVERGNLVESAYGASSMGGRTALAEAPAVRPSSDEEGDRFARLERQIASLAEAMARSQSQPAAKPEIGGISSFLRGRSTQPEPAQVVQPLQISLPEPAEEIEVSVAPADIYEPLMEQLRKSQVAEALTRRIRDELPHAASAEEARAQLHDSLVGRILIDHALTPTPGRMTLAAMLGPTGVGKTTTIAKLAANLALVEGLSVGMITLDTQRVAATQQLQSYGEILGIPVRVAHDRSDMAKALAEFSKDSKQIVLIDTPGKGQTETLSLAEMSTALKSVVNVTSYLVLPATLSASNFEHTIARFKKLANPDALILSKLDETADNHCLGFLLNAQAKHQLPLAYVATGPSVPDDLMAADAHVLVSKLLASSMA